MSKSDLAQAAARHLKEILIASDRRAEELPNTMAEEYEIEPGVLRAWLMRDFESLEALDAWVANRREEIARLPELERMRLTQLREDLDAEWKAIEAEFAELLNGMREAFRNKYAAD
jgi:hypothetical protein